ncbi:hypothetical protein D1872_51220 [compost metagenome]
MASFKQLLVTLVQAKIAYDVIEKQIELIGESDDSDISTSLASQMIKARDAMETAKTGVLKKMTLVSNVVETAMLPGWYMVTFQDKDGSRDLLFAPVLSNSLYLIQRNVKEESDWKRSELDTLLPSVVDSYKQQAYEDTVAKKAIKALSEMGWVDWEEEVEDQTTESQIKTSYHAECRWVQRVMGISSEYKAADYRNDHIEEVREAIKRGFSTAERVWVAEDGVEYWFDPDNMMYVYDPSQQTIITVYESDFTFSKDINRSIVFSQLEEIKSAWDKLVDVKECHKDAEDQIAAEIGSIDDQIALLQAEIDLLSAKKQTKLSEKLESLRVMESARTQYTTEFNKLFRYNKISWGEPDV